MGKKLVTLENLQKYNTELNKILEGKVNADGNKVLSDENFTSAEKSKLADVYTKTEVDEKIANADISGDYLPSGGGDMSGDITFTHDTSGIYQIENDAAIGFNDVYEPTIVNPDGRYLNIATDCLDGNYIPYYFPEKSGTLALINDVYTKEEVNVELGNYLPLTGGKMTGSVVTTGGIKAQYIQAIEPITGGTTSSTTGATPNGRPGIVMTAAGLYYVNNVLADSYSSEDELVVKNDLDSLAITTAELNEILI